MSLLLIYFIYFIGLNYSFISRILIKDFKSSFKLLILKKGKKIIKHSFPNIITQLLFKYFKNSRTYSSYYFFEDYIFENSKESRACLIQKKVQIILEDTKYINKNKKQEILTHFSKLRRAKKLNINLYKFFDFSDTENDEIGKNKYSQISLCEDSIEFGKDEVYQSFSSIEINQDIKSNLEFIDNSNNENAPEIDSIRGNFDSLINKYNSKEKGYNINSFEFLNSNKKNFNNRQLNNDYNKLLTLIS